MGVIYKITSPTNRIYIGKAIDFRKRLNSHRWSTKKKNSNIFLVNSLIKYGFDNHIFEIIENNVPNSLLNEREIFWIKELKSYYFDYPKNGMNMTIGGDGNRGTWKYDLERVAFASKLYSGENNPFYGKTHTEENKKFLSNFMKIRNKENNIQIPYWGAVKGWEAVMRKTVVYGNNGNKIGEYKSLTEAANYLGINVGCVKDSISKNRWVNGKYKFFYKTDKNPETIPINDIRFKTENKPILVFDRNMTLLGEYEKAEDAEKVINVPVTTIRRAAAYNKLRPIRKGYVFAYKEEYDFLLKKLVS